MTHHKLYAFLAGAALAALGTAAGAAILDFEALAHDGDGAVFVAGHEEDGFRIASDIDPVLGDMAFGVWGATAAEFNGSTALFNTFVGFGTTLTRLDGGVFTLTSLDVGPLVPDLSGELTFVGTTVAGGTVSRAVAFGPGLAPLTVDFGTAFQDLISVSWAQETENQAHQFDNIRLDETIPIPEPGTVFMLLGGLSALSMLSMRRRSRRVTLGSGPASFLRP
mgnify:CR=1 FL=1|jgi:hypothetical protein